MKKDVLKCKGLYIESGFNKISSEKFLKRLNHAYVNDIPLKIFLSHKMSGLKAEDVRKMRDIYFDVIKQMRKATNGINASFFMAIIIRLVSENTKKENVIDINSDLYNDIINNFKLPVKFELIDNYSHPDVPLDAGRLGHLGKSIMQMDDADLVVFCGKQKANGCKVEKHIVDIYDIPYITLKLGKSSEEENDDEE